MALHLELQPDGVVLCGLAAWGALLVAGLWSAELPAPVLWTLSIGVLLAVGQAIRSQLFGWRAQLPVGVACDAEGEWSLRMYSGSSCRTGISPSSHVFPGGALLVFQGGNWMLLRQRVWDQGEVRRLRVRMRLEGLPGSRGPSVGTRARGGGS